MHLAVAIFSFDAADYLRTSLPRCRRSLPDATFWVVTHKQDTETIASAAALRTQTLLVDKGETYGSVCRKLREAVLQALKAPTWICTTNATVVIDPMLSAIDFAQLQTDSLYGCAVSAVENVHDLSRYTAKEPDVSEVRELRPTHNFYLYHTSVAHKFSDSIRGTRLAFEDFRDKFTDKFMIQLKLAHLGAVDADLDKRVTGRWGVVNAGPRITPVHPAASAPAPPVKKSDALFKAPTSVSAEANDVSLPHAAFARTEVEKQQTGSGLAEAVEESEQSGGAGAGAVSLLRRENVFKVSGALSNPWKQRAVVLDD